MTYFISSRNSLGSRE